MTKRIRLYESFRSKRRDLDRIDETVVQRDNTFIVGGIKVESKTLKSYIKKVKDETGKDISNMYSNMEIAEELVKWSVNSLENIENIPVSALLGGDEEMTQDASEEDIVSEFDEEGDDELELDLDSEEDELDLDSEEDDDNDELNFDDLDEEDSEEDSEDEFEDL